MFHHFRLLAICLIGFSLIAQKSYAEVDRHSLTMVEELVSILSGEFSSQKQMQEDRENKVPEDMKHAWVNKTLFSVDSPEQKSAVMVATTSYVGDDGVWHFDEYEFLVQTFVPEDNGRSVRMFPRRFKEPEQRLPFAREPEKLAAFTAEDLEPAISGSNCEIIWTRSPNGFSGNSKTCKVMSTTKNKMLNWRWHYELTEDALWVEFSGRDDQGLMLDGSPEGLPYRLDRIEQ